MKKLRFGDFFCGCGGFSLGFLSNENYRGLLGVDMWEAAGKVFEHNLSPMFFKKIDLRSDVYLAQKLLVDIDQLDVMLGGPPCQGFSTLGKRRHSDERSDLVDIFLQLALTAAPSVIIMENVRGITSMYHRDGITYPERILKVLRSGKPFSYTTRFLLLNAIDYGIPQTRVRFFTVAVRDDLGGPSGADGIIEGIESRKSRQRRNLRDAIYDLPKVSSGEGAHEISVVKNGVPTTVFNHKAMRHTPALIKRLQHVPPGGGLLDVPKHLLTRHLIKLLDGKYGNGGLMKNIYGRMEWSKPSGTVIAGIDKITCGRFVHPTEDRLLTPRECARIQTFPDNFVFRGSNVTQYYLIGNAVPPAVSKVIADSVSDCFRSKLIKSATGTRSKKLVPNL
jgi:DNA (cytosine-5)-methyltransferase 1